MERKVTWLRIAIQDLQNLYDYIAQDDPRNAREFTDKIVAASRSLSHSAERGHRVEEVNRPDHRQIIIDKNYRLIYRVTKNTVQIRRLIRCSRDLRTALQQKP